MNASTQAHRLTDTHTDMHTGAPITPRTDTHSTTTAVYPWFVPLVLGATQLDTSTRTSPPAIDQPYLNDGEEPYPCDAIEPHLHGISPCSARIAGGGAPPRVARVSRGTPGAPDSVRPRGSHPIVGRNVGMAPPLLGQGGHKTTRGSGLPWVRRDRMGHVHGVVHLRAVPRARGGSAGL